MSSQELRSFFPSPAHPALPIAAQLLSTLRNLTGPGKGVNLKAEERTALVGVAALLGCEKCVSLPHLQALVLPRPLERDGADNRIQNKDLTESSAQKASHVAPSQFRAALALSRRLLASASAASSEALAGSSSSPRGRSSPSKTASNPAAPAGTAESSAEAAARAAALSPFSTPRKKFRPAASGVDISGLNSRGAHSPAKGSPLKQSVTPSTSKRAPAEPPSERNAECQAGAQAQDDANGEELVETPSKRAKIAAMPASSPRTSARKRRADESTSAFFALRPGSMITPPDFSASGANGGKGRERSMSPTPRREALGVLSARRALRGDRKKRRKLDKVDWTFREDLWGGSAVRKRNEETIQRLLHDLPVWLADHNFPPIVSGKKHLSVGEVLLRQAASGDDGMEVDL